MTSFNFKLGKEKRKLNTAWFRGNVTNFLPWKKDLQSENGLEEYILHGWLPDEPFIKKDTKIVPIGSCFAREVAGYLAYKGFTSLQKPVDPTDRNKIIKEPGNFNEGINNTFALRQLFEWIWLNKEPQDETWHNENKEVIARTNKQRQSAKERYNNTEVFILTLGLSEIWYNKDTNDVFWRAVPYEQYDKSKHGFRISTVDENKENLRTIINLINEHAAPNARIIITLSPVPLMATFRPVSCITASSVSKAILRVTIDEVLREYDSSNLFYWPSYEIVKEYAKEPYQDDNRHIERDVVDFIMDKFSRYYIVE